MAQQPNSKTRTPRKSATRAAKPAVTPVVEAVATDLTPEPAPAPTLIAEPEAPVAEPVAIVVAEPAPVEPIFTEAEMAAPPVVEPVVVEPAIAEPATVDTAIVETISEVSTVSEPAKDTIMTTAFDLSFVKSAISGITEKAKAGYAKTSAAVTDYNSFAKGNFEAVVEASKIFTAGFQELTGAALAESKAAFETFAAEAKTLATVKTPAELFKLQGDLAIKHFDDAVAYSSKKSEAVLKLASEASAPLSARVTLAVEKLQAAA